MRCLLREDLWQVTVDGDSFEEVVSFCYLDDVLSGGGKVDAVIGARVELGWSKFRELSGVLYAKDASNKFKGVVYKAFVRTVMLFGCET